MTPELPRTGGALEAGQAYPLGATWTGEGVNFALFSAHATGVELCLFDEHGRHELERYELPEFTDEVWHGYLPGAGPGLVYGYRVHGPYLPEEGHRFNPHKLVLDPYARELVGRLKWGGPIFAYDLRSRKHGHGFDTRDSAPFVYKARVCADAAMLPPPATPRVAWERTVFYEAHVRGFTRLHPELPQPLRGTFAGLGAPSTIAYLKSLGVTSIELLPVHAFVNDGHLIDKGLHNYWGYNTLAFFAPEPRYLAGGGVGEFRDMVARFHDAGLEVILDVVYNHTAEGNELGPTLSFKGIDNASYYRLPENRLHYINDTGTGNTVNLSHPRVVQMVLDSLRYWVTQTGVDGFRFDLATVLAREDSGFDPGSGFLDACRQDPVLSRVKLVAEPWDIGPGGYQPGGFPPGWAEWNDSFRDTVRAFWRGDEGQASELATRLAASADRYDHRGRRPWASVNFVTAHDGFTLHDLVSYNHKHNEANGEDNRDGHDDNRSWNCGIEGATDEPEVIALRERQKRNLLATLLLAYGTPMLVAGDEFGRTQHGNNNAYCQDNELSWLDWAAIDEAGERLGSFVRRLLLVREALPMLRPLRFATGNGAGELRDVVWLSPACVELEPEDWSDPQLRAFGKLADGRAKRVSEPHPGDSAIALLLFNASADEVQWSLPPVPVSDGGNWTRLVDTSHPLNAGFQAHSSGETYAVGPRSFVLFAAAPDEGTAEHLETLVARLRETGEDEGE